MGTEHLVTLFIYFVLAVFVGFEVISKVPTILHTPLMSGSNAIHGIILVGALAIAAPFFRYLLGMHLLDTGGSLLAVGVQHAAFNGAGSLSGVDGGWQYIPAMIVLTLLVAAVRVTHRARTQHAHPDTAPITA